MAYPINSLAYARGKRAGKAVNRPLHLVAAQHLQEIVKFRLDRFEDWLAQRADGAILPVAQVRGHAAEGGGLLIHHAVVMLLHHRQEDWERVFDGRGHAPALVKGDAHFA